jgi:ABC-2 type transport system ATP-binding protein
MPWQKMRAPVPALSITDLRKTYATGSVALRGVTLEIPEGDFFALLGPNGAGKTTIIGIVTGIVTKTAGRVSVFGVDADREPGRAKSFMGVVPQEPNFNIFDPVIDVIVNQAGYYGVPRRIAVPRAEKLMSDLGLHEKRNNKSMTLSGGMKRRLMIARALVTEPRFLILDEPTAGVDVELRRGMWDFLTKLRESGTTILLTTHYLEEAERLARQVAIINHGEIIESGTVRDILSKLQTEMIVLELDAPPSDTAVAALAAFKPRVVDGNSVEVEVSKERTLGDAIMALEKTGVKVLTAHNKSGRLEEAFLRLTSNNG